MTALTVSGWRNNGTHLLLDDRLRYSRPSTEPADDDRTRESSSRAHQSKTAGAWRSRSGARNDRKTQRRAQFALFGYRDDGRAIDRILATATSASLTCSSENSRVAGLSCSCVASARKSFASARVMLVTLRISRSPQRSES